MFRNFEDTSTQMSNNETFVWSWLICSLNVDAFWKHWIWPRGAYESTDKKHLWPEPLPPRPRPLTTNIWIPFALTRGLSLPISRTSTHAWKSGGPGHPTREVMKRWEAELQQEELPLHQGITANELRIDAFWCDGVNSAQRKLNLSWWPRSSSICACHRDAEEWPRATRLGSLLQRLTMLLGTDKFPIQHPPQLWHDIGWALKPRFFPGKLRKLSSQWWT